MQAKKARRSKYLEGLSKGSVVVAMEEGVGDPHLVETVLTGLTDPLVARLRKAGQDARAVGIQRMETDCRIDGYRREIEHGYPLVLESFVVHLVSYKDEDAAGRDMFVLVDALHKLTAAIDAYERGNRSFMLSIHVWVASGERAARMFAAQFDSRQAVRSASDLINTTFGRDEAKMLKDHIRLLNAALVNILGGCHSDLANAADSEPRFKRMRILSASNLEYIRYNHMDLLRWFNDKFPVRGEVDRSGKTMNVGVVTAIILSKLVYKDGVWRVWEHYTKGTFPSDAGFGAMSALWRFCLQNRQHGGGERVQLDMFQRTVHAFLTAWNYPQTHTEEPYQPDATYQISRGIIAVKKTAKVDGKVTVMATATAEVKVKGPGAQVAHKKVTAKLRKVA